MEYIPRISVALSSVLQKVYKKLSLRITEDEVPPTDSTSTEAFRPPTNEELAARAREVNACIQDRLVFSEAVLKAFVAHTVL